MITQKRKEEIRDRVISIIAWMKSSFFHAEVTLKTDEEAKYAASLWHHGSYDYKNPLKVTFHP